jgi:molybdate/tungstate transport system substrate-binding protein
MDRSVGFKIALSDAVKIAVFCLVLAGGGAEAKEQVIIFHAGSLNVPLAEMVKVFEARHPDIDVVREAGGSTKMARLIAEQHRPADIMASADYTVIDKTLIPELARWNIRFATNQLVLCYTEKSRYASDVNRQNWFDILVRDDVKWGHSDPNLDPCGYRSLMVLQLAEKFYKKPGLYDRLVANRPSEHVLPKAAELVESLKAGKLDYIWEYLSVAVQHNLKYVRLDDHINLGNYQFDEFYQQAEVKVTGNDPGTWTTRKGSSITYGVTLINGCPNPSGAVLFLQFLLNPNDGLKILDDMGQPPFIPCRVPTEEMWESLPETLKKLVEVQN